VNSKIFLSGVFFWLWRK